MSALSSDEAIQLLRGGHLIEIANEIDSTASMGLLVTKLTQLSVEELLTSPLECLREAGKQLQFRSEAP